MTRRWEGEGQLSCVPAREEQGRAGEKLSEAKQALEAGRLWTKLLCKEAYCTLSYLT